MKTIVAERFQLKFSLVFHKVLNFNRDLAAAKPTLVTGAPDPLKQLQLPEAKSLLIY